MAVSNIMLNDPLKIKIKIYLYSKIQNHWSYT